MKRVALTGGPPLTLSLGSMGPVRVGPRGGRTERSSTRRMRPPRVCSASQPLAVIRPCSPNPTGSVAADHLWPELLPGGQAVLFTISAATGGPRQRADRRIRLGDWDVQSAVRGGHHAHYLPTGHLVYGAGGTLRAVAFDRDRLEVAGTLVVVLEQVVTSVGGAVDAAVAANGTMAYVPGRGGPGAARSLVWVDRMGREERVPTPPAPTPFHASRRMARAWRSPSWTRSRTSGSGTSREKLTRFTFDPGTDQYPLWSPDSRRLIFASTRVGANLFWQAADGTGPVEQLTEGPTFGCQWP